MKYKESFYNLKLKTDFDGNVLLCNLSTLSIAWIKKYLYDKFHNEEFVELDKEYYEMVKHRFIVPFDENELSMPYNKRKKYINEENTEHMTFVIAPTMYCNYHCKYCFENNVDFKKSMSIQDVPLIVKFISDSVRKNSNCKYLHITFFGGEPTLKLNILFEIGMQISSFCTEQGISFDSSIVSNGYLLDYENTKMLIKTCNLIRCQITIDGNADYYSFIKDVPREYFYQVVKNIENICDRVEISVRVNVCKNNDIDAIKLFKYMLVEKNLNNKIKIYAAPVIDYNANEVSNLYNQSDFEKFCQRLNAEMENCNLSYMYQKNIPTLKPAYCGAMKRIFCCIGPDLLLYRCEHYIGRKEYAIGNVRDGYNEENELDKKFLSDLPIKCRSCKFLIICQGGCQANRLLDNIEPECEYMERSVRWQIENLLKGNKKESECYGIDFSNIEC